MELRRLSLRHALRLVSPQAGQLGADPGRAVLARGVAAQVEGRHLPHLEDPEAQLRGAAERGGVLVSRVDAERGDQGGGRQARGQARDQVDRLLNAIV